MTRIGVVAMILTGVLVVAAACGETSPAETAATGTALPTQVTAPSPSPTVEPAMAATTPPEAATPTEAPMMDPTQASVVSPTSTAPPPTATTGHAHARANNGYGGDGHPHARACDGYGDDTTLGTGGDTHLCPSGPYGYSHSTHLDTYSTANAHGNNRAPNRQRKYRWLRAPGRHHQCGNNAHVDEPGSCPPYQHGGPARQPVRPLGQPDSRIKRHLCSFV